MILDQFRLDGQVALVTGGSRGLGLGIAAKRAAAAGRRLLPLALDSRKAMRPSGRWLRRSCIGAGLIFWSIMQESSGGRRRIASRSPARQKPGWHACQPSE